MNRFFVDIDGRDIGTDIEITGGDVNHIKNVLRLKIGEEILVSDGRGREIPNYCGIRSETVRARDRSRDYRTGIICQSAGYGVGT